MKVICINSGLHITKEGFVNNATILLKEGNKYTVIEIVENSLGEVGYILSEVKSPNRVGSFSDRRFISCSDIDETILINNKNTVYEPKPLR